MVREWLKLQEAEYLLQERGLLTRRIKNVDDIVQGCLPTDEEAVVRERLFHRLKKVLGSIFEGCQVRAYGSSGTAFGGRGSDVDVVVLTAEYLRASAQDRLATVTMAGGASTNLPHTDHGQDDQTVRNIENIRTLVRELATRLQEQYNDEFTIELAVVFKHVRVPLLKLKHKPTSIAVDVTVSSLKKKMLKADPSPSVVVLKQRPHD